jgi:exodeoxyribonuclease V gamma subunit
VRENFEQPPAVLVSQLRDYLAAGWGKEVVAQRTTEHPLQPFSRRYFEAGPDRLFTYAKEWRAAHDERATQTGTAAALPFQPDPNVPLTVASLASFLRSPVKSFFRSRLSVVFRDEEGASEDDEAFELDGLTRYQLLERILDRVLLQASTGAPGLGRSAGGGAAADEGELRRRVNDQVAAVRRTGVLPVGESGAREAQALVDEAVPMLECWAELISRYPQVTERKRLQFTVDDLMLADWLGSLRCAAGDEGGDGPPVLLELRPSRLRDDKQGTVQPDKLIVSWVRSIAAAACGFPMRTVVVGRDATVTLDPLPQEDAIDALTVLMRAWREGMSRPLPLAKKTALAQLGGVGNLALVYEGGQNRRGEVEEDPCLARTFPDLSSLVDSGEFDRLAQELFGPVCLWSAGRAKVETHAQSAARRGGRALVP